MINSICKFNLFMGPSEHNFRFREIVFQPFWKITSNKQLQLTKPEWWLKFFLRKFQTLIIIVTTNVTVCALRNGVWYSSFLCSFPNYFCMMAQTSVTSFVGFLKHIWNQGNIWSGMENKHILVALGFPVLYPIIYNPVWNYLWH